MKYLKLIVCFKAIALIILTIFLVEDNSFTKSNTQRYRMLSNSYNQHLIINRKYRKF
jgi:hypothetical protein